jgi:hypothetical protein
LAKHGSVANWLETADATWTTGLYFFMKGDRLIVQANPVLWSAGRYVSTRVRRCVARTGLRRAIARGPQ